MSVQMLVANGRGYTNVDRYVGEDEEGEWGAIGTGFPGHDGVFEGTTRSTRVGAKVLNMRKKNRGMQGAWIAIGSKPRYVIDASNSVA